MHEVARRVAIFSTAVRRGARSTVKEVVPGKGCVPVGLVGSGSPAAEEEGGAAERWQVLTIRDGLIADIRGFDGRAEAAARADVTPAPGRAPRPARTAAGRHTDGWVLGERRQVANNNLGTDKDVEALARAARKSGWRVGVDGANHLRWQGPDGQELRSPLTGGPSVPLRVRRKLARARSPQPAAPSPTVDIAAEVKACEDALRARARADRER
ncbi:MAG: hypothetical protein ACYDEN_04520 [Acidimicrobiales bacterium]